MKKKYLIYLIMVLLGSMFLTACRVRELEDRQFALSASFNRSGNNLEVIYGFPNLSAVTQQDKEQDDIHTMPKLTGADMEEIHRLYYQSSDRYLDYGHMQAIILGPELMQDTESLRGLLSYLEQNQLVARNVLVFIAEPDPEEIMLTNGGVVPSLGEYLNNLYKNSPYEVEQDAVTLGRLLNHWHNQEAELEVPVLSIVDSKPVIIKMAVLEKLVYKNE